MLLGASKKDSPARVLAPREYPSQTSPGVHRNFHIFQNKAPRSPFRYFVSRVANYKLSFHERAGGHPAAKFTPKFKAQANRDSLTYRGGVV